MEDKTKFFYVKIKVTPDLDLMERLFISESKETIDEWDGSVKTRKVDEPHDEDKQNSNVFQQISIDFESSVKQFQMTVPFIMKTIPIMRKIEDDRSIRKYVSPHGEKLSDVGHLETYRRLSVDHIDNISKRLDKSTTISSGTNSIPILFMVGLVSAYDLFLSKLIKNIFIVRPELLSSSDRNISFKDLIAIGSVEAARERIVEKEVETIIRDSHHKQIQWLETKLDVHLRKDLQIWPEFVEICERRNLLTHSDGIVSSQYLTVCKDNNFNADGVKVGDRLNISAKYYDRAVEVVLAFGVKLTQVIWRKLVPAEIGEAEMELNRIAYRLITEREYKTAITFLRFGLFEMKKHGEDSIRKTLVINLANAEKLSGNIEEAERILNSEDWSASTDKFLICIAAVRDDTAAVIKMMKGVIAAGQLKIASFQQWPVFAKMRSNPEFISRFEREFGQKIVVDVETSSLTSKLAADEEGDDLPSANSDTVHKMDGFQDRIQFPTLLERSNILQEQYLTRSTLTLLICA